jgi:hypothetical protein
MKKPPSKITELRAELRRLRAELRELRKNPKPSPTLADMTKAFRAGIRPTAEERAKYGLPSTEPPDV